jgi:integrase
LSRSRPMFRRGDWIDPDAGKVSLKECAATWIAQRDLEDRTHELYAGYLRNHINPTLGNAMLCEISAPRVRTWRTELQQAGVGEPTIARCYALLRAVLNTAVDDEILKRNPCRIRGAGQTDTPERPTAPLAEVFAIAASIVPRYRLLVLLAAFGQLRFGELVALRRPDLTVPARRRPTAGGTLTAQTGATLKEIMSRIGHGSTRAAMIYQHATS